jgi:shikimate kinase
MKRIFLIGYMGAGKTTIGKTLSKRMGLAFIDLDCHIEARYHRTINCLFAERGESAFREIEYRLLHEVAMFENVLISTGGGVPCFFDNMAFMNEAGLTVYLKVSPAELSKRLELAWHIRPVLGGRSGSELLSFVSESLEKRKPYYIQASVVFDTEIMRTESDVQVITNELKKIL